jgi:hypothetical protein
MMHDAEKTIGTIIDSVQASLIGSVDEHGYPNAKAMLPPRKREGIKHIYFTTNTSSMRVGQYGRNRIEADDMERRRRDVLPERGDGSRLLRVEIYGAKREVLLQVQVGKFYG